MRHINYVSTAHIIEKVKDEELPNVNSKEMKIKEWIYEALRFLGSAIVYEASTIEVTVDTTNKRAKMPDHINYIRVIKDENGLPMEEIHTSFEEQLSNGIAYFIRGRHVYINCSTKKLKVEAFQIPTDAAGNPEIVDNPYVVAAVVAYVAFKVAKRLWLTKRLSDNKFDYLEREWLFYVGAAEADMNRPSFDELRNWDVLNIGFPLTQIDGPTNIPDSAAKYVSSTNEIVT